MIIVNEVQGSPNEAQTFENVLFTRLSLLELNTGKYEGFKHLQILMILTTLADQHKLNTSCPIDLIKAKLLLRDSVLYN